MRRAGADETQRGDAPVERGCARDEVLVRLGRYSRRRETLRDNGTGVVSDKGRVGMKEPGGVLSV